MIGYRYDDGGRRAAGYRGDTGDCVVRAIAICAGKDYKAVYLTMAEHMRRNGYAASGNAYATSERRRKAPRRRGQLRVKDVQDRVLEVHGFRKVRLPSGVRPTFTEAHERYGDCIVGTTKHMAAIVGGALRDIWDGRTYAWVEPDTGGETRERKAQSVWVRPHPAPERSTQTAGGTP